MVDTDVLNTKRLQKRQVLRAALRTEMGIKVDDAQIRVLVRDLHRVRPKVYWTDLMASVTVGWSCFAAAVALPLFSLWMLASAAVAVLALYRALSFMHEVAHQSRRTLPGFESAWNALVGFPLMMPSFVHAGVHCDHHKLSTYGTDGDPEYLPFARSARMSVLFMLNSFLIPAAQLIRFLVLGPIGLIYPRFQRWLVAHASSFTINFRYHRFATPALIKTIRRESIIVWAVWSSFLALAIAGFVPLRSFAIWYLVTASASFVNTLRTLGAHAYESSGEPLDRLGQLVDSIDTPGRFWSELWAPVGLRFHALHHYFPGIPYHHLPEAYRRVAGTSQVAAAYRKMTSPSLPISLGILVKKGLRKKR